MRKLIWQLLPLIWNGYHEVCINYHLLFNNLVNYYLANVIESFLFLILLFIYLWMWTHEYMEVRGLLVEVRCILLPCRSWGTSGLTSRPLYPLRHLASLASPFFFFFKMGRST